MEKKVIIGNNIYKLNFLGVVNVDYSKKMKIEVYRLDFDKKVLDLGEKVEEYLNGFVGTDGSVFYLIQSSYPNLIKRVMEEIYSYPYMDDFTKNVYLEVGENIIKGENLYKMGIGIIRQWLVYDKEENVDDEYGLTIIEKMFNI